MNSCTPHPGSYLGTCGFFREFVPSYSTTAAPLDALRNRADTFTLNETEKQAFDVLRKILLNAPILSFPDFSKPFYMATDASNVGIGAVLYQLPKGPKYPNTINYIFFVSRSLQERERRYSATKRELLAIVFALNRSHYYLWGRHFEFFTDHKALISPIGKKQF